MAIIVRITRVQGSTPLKKHKEIYMFFTKNKRRLMLMGIDLLSLIIVYGCGFLLEFITFGDRRLEILTSSFTTLILNFIIFAIAVFASRLAFKIYSNMWRYANSKAYLDMVFADAIGGAIAFIFTRIVRKTAINGWLSIAIIAMFTCATLSLRFVYQQYYKQHSIHNAEFKDNKISVAIIGAGQVGALLAEELLCYRGSHYRPVCFVDKNPSKAGARVV